ncbi:hypothetical protein [Pontibacter liquoris]|uniref:hypothetical protein n=1 Tax=Pontibacter liquoris TaxID=2905677 RepID=UPI001FA6F9D9|nr:hypothetical protein [Pontibacter liquoris]
MKHLQTLLLLLLFTLASSAAFAQSAQERERKEHIQAAKTAYLTDKMHLTPEQSQKFWPLYNEYEARRHDIYASSRSIKRADPDEMNDQEIQATLDSKFERDQKVLNLEKEYAARFQKVISSRQLLQLYRSEHEFTKLLLKRLDDKNARNNP